MYTYPRATITVMQEVITSLHMPPRTLAVRAIGAVYIQQLVRPLVRIAALVTIALVAGTIYLAVEYSGWWLLFLLPLSVALLVVIVANIVATFAVRLIAPPMNKAQRRAADTYVKNMYEVVGGLQTPRFVIAFKIIFDVLRRRWSGGFIQQLTANSVRLKKDFDALVVSFTR
jgi:hypothetical protein